MTLRRQVKRIGGSLGVLLPRDFADAMNVKDGSAVRLTLVGRQMVIEPEDELLDDRSVQRAYAAVLRRHATAFDQLARYDRSQWRPRKR
jgi:antitoxin component of MazEF toxin-antitoxin module